MLRAESKFAENADYQTIKILFDKSFKNNPEIIKEFETLGFEVATPMAQLFLGLVYESHVFCDDAKAAKFYKKAAHQQFEKSEDAKKLYIASQQRQYLETGKIIFDTLEDQKLPQNPVDIISKKQKITTDLVPTLEKKPSLIEMCLTDKRMAQQQFITMFKDYETYQLTHVSRNLNSLFKDSAIRAREKLEKLLRYVAMSNRKGAESILKENSDLLLMKGEFTDPFNRHFKRISPFQYAVWAQDRHMWDMLKKYMPDDVAKRQLDELELKGTEHGKFFDFLPLINTFKIFISNYYSLFKSNRESFVNQLVKEIGGAQRNSVAHLVCEYNRNDRAFFPCPDFKDTNLPSDLPKFQDISILPSLPVVKDFGIGTEYCLLRGSANEHPIIGRAAYIYHVLREDDESMLYDILKDDLEAIVALQNQRKHDFKLLKESLTFSKCLIL